MTAGSVAAPDDESYVRSMSTADLIGRVPLFHQLPEEDLERIAAATHRASYGGGEIVFQYGSGLRLLDLETRAVTSVEISIPGDRPTLRDRRIDVPELPRNRREVDEDQRIVWSLLQCTFVV